MREAINRAGEEANATIDTSFANVERRSGDLTNRLRGGLTASLSDVERMLGEAGRASDSAAQNLRESLRDAIDDAVGRFSGATEDIRRSATDIRSELDATRAELKRGAFDLPEEAKESASAMRRAVAEQIKALQDISQIVGRSSQRLELSEPVARTLAQAEPAQRVTQPVIPTAPAPQPAPTARQSIESMGLRGTIAPTPAAAPAPTPAPQRPVAQAPQPAPAPAPVRQEAPRTEATSGGWISDLLRGASREETEEALRAAPARPAAEAAAPAPAPAQRANDSRNPRHVVESLNSLSVDIARAIDHDASVDLWRRYQRGERDVFTRRLYTLKGQQTFDEIKRKYDREPEFRTAVDRYIGDFEKLLADVARTDPNRTVTQSYLTSDTGKVYTMLAHAAGRLN
jgi:ElaB/YqjD/DUF883 family membrane-anchored ribosome-binding protein